MPKPLSRQSQVLVENLILYFEREKLNGKTILPLQCVRERTANALQINMGTISKISARQRRNEAPCNPKKSRPKPKTKCETNALMEAAIRNAIYEIYREREPVTCTALLRILKTEGTFSGCENSLRKLIRIIGFKFTRHNEKATLYELPYIAAWRVRFLREYVRNLNLQTPHQLVYLGEMWASENTEAGQSLKKIKQCLIVHAGTEGGFIAGANLILPARNKSANFSNRLSAEHFLRWFEFQVLKKLEYPSVIVMDSVPCHNLVEEEIPKSTWRRQDIQAWCTKKNIAFEGDMLKAELLHLIATKKPEKVYVADKLAALYGHRVLRVPPFHGAFNAIEGIWQIVKQHHNNTNKSVECSETEFINKWNEALDHITPDTWKCTVKRTNEEIKKWWDRELLFDSADVAPLIVHIDDDSSAEEYFETDSGSE